MSLIGSPTRKWLGIVALGMLIISSVLANRFFDSSQEGSAGQRRASQHAEFGVTQEHILFAGDDLTEEALWNEMFPSVPVRNRGIAGLNSERLLKTIPDHLADQPRAVFINVGASDIHDQIPLEQVSANVRELINISRSLSPDTQLFISSVLPLRNGDWRKVRRLNTLLRELADDRNIVFVDLEPMLNEQGHFQAGFADRRMRLLGPGYSYWRDALQAHIDTLKR